MKRLLTWGINHHTENPLSVFFEYWSVFIIFGHIFILAVVIMSSQVHCVWDVPVFQNLIFFLWYFLSFYIYTCNFTDSFFSEKLKPQRGNQNWIDDSCVFEMKIKFKLGNIFFLIMPYLISNNVIEEILWSQNIFYWWIQLPFTVQSDFEI